jgi:hypothetical protein
VSTAKLMAGLSALTGAMRAVAMGIGGGADDGCASIASSRRLRSPTVCWVDSS